MFLNATKMSCYFSSFCLFVIVVVTVSFLFVCLFVSLSLSLAVGGRGGGHWTDSERREAEEDTGGYIRTR